MIPIRSVEDAGEQQPPMVGEVVVGADIERGGNDATVFVARCGMNAFAAVEYKGMDTMESTARLAAFCREVKAQRAQIDVVGLGAGVVDRLAELMPELDIVEMNAGKKARDEEHYANAGAVKPIRLCGFNPSDRFSQRSDANSRTDGFQHQNRMICDYYRAMRGRRFVGTTFGRQDDLGNEPP